MTARALAHTATVHPGFSVLLLVMAGGGVLAFVVLGVIGVGEGFGGNLPAVLGWVAPLCIFLAVCGAVCAVFAVCAQVAIWAGIT